MGAQIVFLTLFLGIVSGTQPLVLEVTGPVRIVQRIEEQRHEARGVKAVFLRQRRGVEELAEEFGGATGPVAVAAVCNRR